jgi:hypothetical protein
LKWKSNDWLQKDNTEAISSPTACPYKLEGLLAYVHQQAQIFCDFLNHFLGIWKGLKQPQEPFVKPIHPVDLDPDAMELDRDDA